MTILQIFIHYLPVQLVVGSEVGISYVTDNKSAVSSSLISLIPLSLIAIMNYNSQLHRL